MKPCSGVTDRKKTRLSREEVRTEWEWSVSEIFKTFSCEFVEQVRIQVPFFCGNSLSCLMKTQLRGLGYTREDKARQQFKALRKQVKRISVRIFQRYSYAFISRSLKSSLLLASYHYKCLSKKKKELHLEIRSTIIKNKHSIQQSVSQCVESCAC